MSRTDDRDAVFDWPRCARSLLIVREAISLAFFSAVPRSSSESLMCSYFRSCLSVHSLRGICDTSCGIDCLPLGTFPIRGVEQRSSLTISGGRGYGGSRPRARSGAPRPKGATVHHRGPFATIL